MTEFEINKKVAEKLGLDFLVLGKEVHYRGIFNPCNNIEQAWPIMIRGDICITRNNDNDRFYAVSNLHHVDGSEWIAGAVSIHPKPLVAAMLCFLEV